jgi:hypothetical protein
MSTRLAGTVGWRWKGDNATIVPNEVTHQVRALKVEYGDEGGEGVGELRSAPAVVDV